MTWFFMALIAPFLWGILNHVDKYLISKYSAHHTGVGALVVYSSIFALFVIPVVLIFERNVFEVAPFEIFLLVITGVFYSLAVLLYMYALEKEDASYVVPFWQLIPVLAFVFGFVLLGEKISSTQIMGGIITIIGAIILSLEIEEGKKFKGGAVWLMVFSSLLLALSDTMFKFSALDASFWSSIFWNQVGMGLFGIALLIFVREYRKDFIFIIKKGGRLITGLNVGGEIVQSIASIFNYFSTLLAPVALVLLVSYTFQPLFVFLLGVVLTIFFPHISVEKISKKHMAQKLLSMVIMGIGVYFIV